MNNVCPCCDNHCTIDNLHCHKGREHFGIKEEERPVNPDEKMIVLLRQCGHFLHHNVGRDGDTAPLINALSSEERASLETLLEKCLKSWQNL